LFEDVRGYCQTSHSVAYASDLVPEVSNIL
jgi:hypothetical protein